jgi:hypothetical protein
VCFASLIALFYGEEDWRGWSAWNKFKREWEAKGEHFDYASVVPPPVPDEQNFAMSPFWIAEEKFNFRQSPERAKAWYGDRIYSEEVSKIIPLLPITVSAVVGTNWTYDMPATPEASGNWATARVTDLKPWQSYYRDLETTNPAAEISITRQPQTPAQDVLLALSKYDPVIEELRRAGQLPDSRFPLNYDEEDPADILLPHLAELKQTSQVLQLRALAELQNGQSEQALDDVKLSLRLVESVRNEPFLISHLVRIAILQITLQPVYEGLAEHKWSDAQLVMLDSELSKLDFLADYKLSMRGEMGVHGGIIRFLRRHPGQFLNLANDVSGNRNMSAGEFAVDTAMHWHLVPSGWFYQNQLHCARAMEEFYLPVADVDQQTFKPAMVLRANAAVETERKKLTPFNILERVLLPALGSAAIKFAYAQSSTDLARTAIALERYRLAHGEFPESLDALAPQIMEKIPQDVIGGQPLHYRRTDDGQFVLYSVGWNETDDGGVVGRTTNGKGVNNRNGDWVWRYPSK